MMFKIKNPLSLTHLTSHGKLGVLDDFSYIRTIIQHDHLWVAKVFKIEDNIISFDLWSGES
jgi:hypothetical protein